MFHYADYIIFLLFLIVSLAIGLYHAYKSRKNKSADEFLMGNRKLHLFPVSVSITLSFISAVLVLGQPAEVHTRGTQFAMVICGIWIGSIISAIVIVPLFYNLRVTSSYEYLEKRFKSEGVKLVGSITMIVYMVFYLGVVLYGPSVALEGVTNIPMWVFIVLSSVIATVYTTLGGMKAVIWTDVFQGLCLITGMVAIVIQGSIVTGGPSVIWQRNIAMNRLELFNMDPNPALRTTFWSAFINGIFVSFYNFGIGQTTVQRYCGLDSLAKARWSLIINAILMTLILGIVTAVGMVVFAYYDVIGCDPIRAKLITTPNQLLPHFIMDVLNYPGFPGLFISVLYGGALSTVSSSLNSLAAVCYNDLLKKFLQRRNFSDSRKTLATKILGR
ncbi:hypothetical protein HELRODRAFT_79055 [Helobdella robusta]|uniref:Sodium/solute symporter n=1 Tax=Helobdella robusta TaxID=6412 RepID=T1G3J6_HELRO|nr:hypothetical protein HELRODRAFT_79055 [Helobdella robusta]ESO04547.1 hypothetical protein HELRODRAFT_79055 [Helobdella robusta]